MKKFTLQLQNIDGEVLEEKQVNIGEGDTLVMHYPKDMTLEQASRSFTSLKQGIETGSVVGLVDTITFSVIKKEIGKVKFL